MRSIKDLREERHASRDELADFLGISLSSLGYYERGERLPDADTVVRLAEFFDVSTDYLLGLSAYRSNSHNAAIDEMFDKLPTKVKNQCTEIQMALIRAADVYRWAHSTGLIVSPELFGLLIDDLLKYIAAYQHIIEDNTPETNLATSPHFFVNQFIYETYQTGENLSKVVECLFTRGNIISDAILRSGEEMQS